MNIVLTTTLTGSCLFLLILAVEHHFKDRLSLRWYYHMFRLSVLTFLLPLGFTKMYLEPFMAQFLQFGKANETWIFKGDAPVKTVTPLYTSPNIIYRFDEVLFYSWIGIAAVLFSIWLYRYLVFKKNVMVRSATAVNPDILDILERKRKHMGIRRPVKLLFTSASVSPFTTGLFHPIIVFPDHIDPRQLELALIHELTHIKHYDMVFIILRRLAVFLNWFNPLIYVLNRRLEKITEFECDDRVVRNMEPSERKVYIHMLLDMASHETNRNRAFLSALNSNTNYFTERMDTIMKTRKSNKINRRLSLLLALCLVFSCSFTVFAYQTPDNMKLDGNLYEDVYSGLNTSKEYVSFSHKTATQSSDLFPILYDTQFIGKDGTIYEIEDNQIAPRTNCDHDFEDGELSRHSQRGSGCITKYYSAKRCSKCELYRIGEYLYEISYVTCPH